ncbi:MAG: SLC13 family permease, partial [Pseudooceanicola sp.]
SIVVGVAIIGRQSCLSDSQAFILFAVAMTVLLWLTGSIAQGLTSLVFLTVLAISPVLEPRLVFSGFLSSAMWLVVSGYVIGTAIRRTGLDGTIARFFGPSLERNYVTLIGGLVALGTLLSFLMPSSTGRAAVLIPIGMAIADRLGFLRGTNGRTGVVLAIAFGATLPGFSILTANIPNVVLAGISETLIDEPIGYGDYLLLHFPVLGVLKGALITLIVISMYPATIDGQKRSSSEDAATTEPDRRQGALGAILGVMILLWATDRLHGVSPAWVGLAACCLLMLPGVRFVSQEDFRGAIDFGVLLLVAAVLAMGVAVSEVGLGEILAARVTSILPLKEGEAFLNFVSLSTVSFVTSLFATAPGVPAILTPLAPDFAEATRLSLRTTLMTQVIGFSTVAMPYQAAPLVIAMGLAGERVAHVVRVGLVLTLFTFVLLVPAAFLWWRLLGAI